MYWYSLIGGGLSLYMVRLQNVIKQSRDGDFMLLYKIPGSTIKLPPCSRSLFESRVALKRKHSHEVQARAYLISCEFNTPQAGEAVIMLFRNGQFVIWKWNLHVCHKWKCEVDRPFRSVEVNQDKKQKSCSLWCPSSQVQQDTSGPSKSQTLGYLLTKPHRSVCKEKREEKEEIWFSPMRKALTPAEMSKGQSDNINNATKKFDYTAIADDLGRSVGVTSTTQLVWLTGLRAQPSNSPQQPCNQKDTH